MVREAGKVQHLGVGAAPGHNELGPVLLSQPLNLVVVDKLGVLIHAIGNEVVQLAGEVDPGAVGQVAAVVQLHPQHRVARFQQGKIDRHVGLGAAVGLDIGVFRPEQLLGPLDGQGFHHVHVFAAAVVATAGIALGVLVVHHAGLGFQHRLAGVVFRCDEDDAIPLPRVLQFNGPGHFRVLPGKQGHNKSLPFQAQIKSRATAKPQPSNGISITPARLGCQNSVRPRMGANGRE